MHVARHARRHFPLRDSRRIEERAIDAGAGRVDAAADACGTHDQDLALIGEGLEWDACFVPFGLTRRGPTRHLACRTRSMRCLKHRLCKRRLVEASTHALLNRAEARDV